MAPQDEAAAREYVTVVVGAERCKDQLKSPKFAAWLQEHEEAGQDLVLSPTTDLGKRALRRARQFFKESGLRNWVRDVNVKKGLAPKGRNVWGEYSQRAATQGYGSGATDPGSVETTQRARGQWLRRWARRWGIRRGKFRVGERLSAAELLKKASHFGTCRAPIFPFVVSPTRDHFSIENEVGFDLATTSSSLGDTETRAQFCFAKRSKELKRGLQKLSLASSHAHSGHRSRGDRNVAMAELLGGSGATWGESRSAAT